MPLQLKLLFYDMPTFVRIGNFKILLVWRSFPLNDCLYLSASLLCNLDIKGGVR